MGKGQGEKPLVRGWGRGALWVAALLLFSPGLLQAVEKPPPRTPADKLWAKAMKATGLGKWDLAKAILMQFTAKYPDDGRAQEARDRATGNAFLAAVPYCLNGPEENRIDVTVSADGLTSGQKDQDLLKRIAKALCDDPPRRITFTVRPMKPLDHALTVEWRVDGTLQTKNVKRGFIHRKTGKKAGRPAPFPVNPRKSVFPSTPSLLRFFVLFLPCGRPFK